MTRRFLFQLFPFMLTALPGQSSAQLLSAQQMETYLRSRLASSIRQKLDSEILWGRTKEVRKQ